MIFALNNNEDVDVAEGGSHWTLLVYSRSVPTSFFMLCLALIISPPPNISICYIL